MCKNSEKQFFHCAVLRLRRRAVLGTRPPEPDFRLTLSSSKPFLASVQADDSGGGGGGGNMHLQEGRELKRGWLSSQVVVF